MKEAKQRGEFCPWFIRTERSKSLWSQESPLGKWQTLRRDSSVAKAGLPAQGPRASAKIRWLSVRHESWELTCFHWPHRPGKWKYQMWSYWTKNYYACSHFLEATYSFPFLSNPVMMGLKFHTRPLWELRVMFREWKSYQVLTSIKCLLFARHFSKYFTWSNSFNSHGTSVRCTMSCTNF